MSENKNNQLNLRLVRATLIRIAGLKYSAADHREAASKAQEFAQQYEHAANGFRTRTSLEITSELLDQMLYPKHSEPDDRAVLLVSRGWEEQKIDLPPLDLDPLSAMSVIEQMEILIPLYRQAADEAIKSADKFEKEADFLIEELKNTPNGLESINKLLIPALNRVRRNFVNFVVVVNGVDLQSYIDEINQDSFRPPKSNRERPATIIYRKDAGVKLN